MESYAYPKSFFRVLEAGPTGLLTQKGFVPTSTICLRTDMIVPTVYRCVSIGSRALSNQASESALILGKQVVICTR